MTCQSCKNEWCWICQGKYTYNHYEFGSTCFGLQFTENIFVQYLFQSCLFRWTQKFIMILFYIFAGLFAFIAFFVFGTSILLIAYSYDEIDNEFFDDDWTTFFKKAHIILVIGVAGLIFQPVVLSLFLFVVFCFSCPIMTITFHLDSNNFKDSISKPCSIILVFIVSFIFQPLIDALLIIGICLCVVLSPFAILIYRNCIMDN